MTDKQKLMTNLKYKNVENYKGKNFRVHEF